MTINYAHQLSISQRYYDSFSKKLVADYVHGNGRLESAILHALRWIPPGAKSVLDIGCGIGWSTWEFKRHRADASILGVDLSQQSIATARRLFEAPKLTFSILDIVNSEGVLTISFDAIIMLDVYEHIPHQVRSQLHAVLAQLLADKGLLILSCPTVEHQQFLQKSGQSMQPVDEKVTENDITRMTEDIGGKLVQFDYVSIWNPNDYFHAAVMRHSNGPRSILPAELDSSLLEVQHLRSERVKNQLGVRVSKDGLFVSEKGESTVCVVTPTWNTNSETFIRTHIERIPARVIPVHGVNLINLRTEQGPLIPPFSLRRIVKESLDSRLRGLEWKDYRRSFVRNFFRDKGIEVVLAEYGTSGAMIMDICRECNIPLIVHFHGFDIYQTETLETTGQYYPELFRTAQSLIAVSRDMERQLLSLGAPREKIHYNPCGVDVTQFKGARPSFSAPHFVSVGRFVDKKSPLSTLLAFDKVVRSVPEARLTMIGDGYLLEGSKQLAAALGLFEKVDFLGEVSPVFVRATMQTARAFVQHSVRTSYGDAEGTPVAVLEACATGLPVVATKHMGISDVIVHGETGFLVDEGNIEAMAQNMLRLAADSELAETMGKAGRARVVKEFSMEKSISHLWRIIEASIN